MRKQPSHLNSAELRLELNYLLAEMDLSSDGRSGNDCDSDSDSKAAIGISSPKCKQVLKQKKQDCVRKR